MPILGTKVSNSTIRFTWIALWIDRPKLLEREARVIASYMEFAIGGWQRTGPYDDSEDGEEGRKKKANGDHHRTEVYLEVRRLAEH